MREFYPLHVSRVFLKFNILQKRMRAVDQKHNYQLEWPNRIIDPHRVTHIGTRRLYWHNYEHNRYLKALSIMLA